MAPTKLLLHLLFVVEKNERKTKEEKEEAKKICAAKITCTNLVVQIVRRLTSTNARSSKSLARVLVHPQKRDDRGHFIALLNVE